MKIKKCIQKMKKVVVTIIYLLSVTYVYSQIQTDTIFLQVGNSETDSLLVRSAQATISDDLLQKWREDNDKQIPISPNAASLGQYGSMPVGHYTGVPNINIPLYEIDLDGKKIPISLSYHASGIKVAQDASWVGLGWSLNLGGGITRQIKGIEDFEPSFGFYNIDYLFPNSRESYTITSVQYPDLVKIEDVINEKLDSEPDLFQFNFGNHTGSFYVNKKGVNGNTSLRAKAEILNKNEYIDIVYNFSTETWLATDGDGFRYYFGTVEKTTPKSSAQRGVLSSDPIMVGYTERRENPTFKTAWMLDSIVSPNNKKIRFSYEIELITTSPSLYEESSHMLDYMQIRGGNWILPAKDVRYMYSRSEIKQARLDKVRFEGGEISFTTSERVDMDGFGRRLDRIDIKNNIEPVKSFNFHYSYAGNTYKTNECRLMLDSIQDDADRLYRFAYNKKNLPEKTSLKCDLWGYYSNAPASGVINPSNIAFTTIPGVILKSESGDDRIFYGSEKYPIEDDMKALVLEKIQYPTGGTTEFEYEGNKASDEPNIRKVGYLKSNPVKGPKIEVWTDAETGNHRVGRELLGEEFIFDKDGHVTINVRAVNRGGPIAGSPIPSVIMMIEKFDETGNTWKVNSNFNAFGGRFPNNETEREGSFFVELGQGKYRSRLFIYNDEDELIHFHLYTTIYTHEYVNYLTPGNEHPIAGLRIKKITDKSDIGSLPLVKEYKYEKEGRSSGILSVIPEFIHEKSIKHATKKNEQGGSNMGTDEASASYIVGRSYPTSPFRLPGASPLIGYSYVEESTADNGKIVYEFYNEKDLLLGYNRYLPDLPTISRVSNGKPKRTTLYDSVGDTLSVTTYHYGEDSYNINSDMRGFKYIADRNQGPTAEIYSVSVKFYDIPFTRAYLSSETTVNYFSDGTKSSLLKKYTYNPYNYLVNSIETNDSKKDKITETIKYPNDYTNNIYTDMIENHFVNHKIEHEKFRNENPIGHLKINYGKINSEAFVPFSAETSSNGILRTDITYDLYDTKGNLLQYTTLDGVSTVYLWSYNYQYPIAEIKNATYDQVSSALSFLGLTISSLGININPDKTTMDTVKALRDQLPNSLVTVYTYKPLVGIETITDPRGVVTTYEYDDFGRLKWIKDSDGNLIEEYKYNYRNK